MLIFELKSDQMNKSIFLLLAFFSFSSSLFALKVDYALKMTNPNSHYFEVEMAISDIKSKQTDVKMPVWAPGSYLVREFSKNVNLVKAFTSDGKEIKVEKITKNTWRINTKGIKEVTVKYEVYAFELSVRTSFLDDSHGYINGTSMFMYVDEFKQIGGTLNILPHPTFKKISTALKNKTGQPNTFIFNDYDQLVDCPIEIGNQIEFTFDAAGVHHTVAMYGEGNYDIPTLKRDMARIVESETKIMGVNPNKNYLFIIHNLTVPSGGLEHVNSTTLQVNRWTYEGNDYLGFLSLVAHEYFHLWNVKRMRPKELGPFNYDSENYTDLLWVMEGFTSYYDELVLRRAGFYSEEVYLNKLFGTINYVENQPGNSVQPVAHASFDAWIKAYRPNENSVNTTISYYSKGQILAAMLDLYIIDKFGQDKSLDDFLQVLYTDFYEKNDVGYTEEEFQATLEKFLGEKMDWFFDQYVYGTEIIDYAKFFKGVGLDILDDGNHASPSLGIATKTAGGKLIISTVYLKFCS
jgi:predicted metalloprotease with PDZ domain